MSAPARHMSLVASHNSPQEWQQQHPCVCVCVTWVPHGGRGRTHEVAHSGGGDPVRLCGGGGGFLGRQLGLLPPGGPPEGHLRPGRTLAALWPQHQPPLHAFSQRHFGSTLR